MARPHEPSNMSRSSSCPRWAGADEPLLRRAWRCLADMPLLRSPLAALLALGAAAALLSGFGHVVQVGVQQAAQRQAETRVQTNEYWRCRLSKGPAARAACLAAPQPTHIATR